MDPQQRMLLETAYRALENGEPTKAPFLYLQSCTHRHPSSNQSPLAGIPITQISGSDTAVFTGYFTADYQQLAGKDPELMPTYAATGFAGSMLSNRISTFFNLTGPSVTIDTACSSSLVALDMACQSLRRGESSLVSLPHSTQYTAHPCDQPNPENHRPSSRAAISCSCWI